MAVATRTSSLFRPCLLASAIAELSQHLRPTAGAVALSFSLMTLPALAQEAPSAPLSNQSSAHRLDWVPVDQLTDAQKAAMPNGCCGAYVTPERTDPDAKLDPASASVRANADSSETQGQTTIIMSGDVQLTQGYRSLNADQAVFNQATRQAEISGNIQIREPGLLLHADNANMDIDSGDATLENAEFVLYESRIRGTAESLQKFGSNIIVLDSSRFTSCEPDSDLWSVVGAEVKINQEKRYGTAKHMRVNIKDFPVLYSPYLRFPVGKDRLTGFLFPSISLDSDTGIEDFAAPFYWNIAPDYDMTITPRYVDRHGTGIDTEFRHMSEQFDTIIGGAFLADDKGNYTARDQERIAQGLREDYTGQDRWIYNINQIGGRGQRWSTLIDYTEISDIDYLRDFNRSGIDTNRQPNIGKLATASYRTDNWLLTAKAQEYRVLVEESQIPYRELPRINADGSYRVGDWLVELNNEYVNFDINSFYSLDTSNILTGERLRTDYALTWDKEYTWGFFKPGVAVKSLHYQLDSGALIAGAKDDPSLVAPQGSLDMGLYFERDTHVFNSSFIQTLEPRAFYFYSDHEDHSELYALTANNRYINFDTSELTFTYSQLFRDSRFSGGDRIDDANQIAVGLSSALISSSTGIERLRMSIGQIFYQQDRRVVVANDASTNDKYSRPHSAIAGQLKGQIGDSLRFTSDVAYDHEDGHLTSASAGINYMDDAYRIVNLSYRYTRDPQMINPSNPTPILESTLDQLDASVIWPVSDQWSLIARSNYDFTYNLELDTFAGLEYNDCCYRIRLLGRRWLNFDYNSNFLATATQDDYDQGFFVDIQLKGLGSISERIGKLLDKAIIGYNDREKSMR